MSKGQPEKFLEKLGIMLGSAGTRGLVVMTILAALASLVEVAGMGSVMQFMSLVSTPERLSEPVFDSLKQWSGWNDPKTLMIGLGVSVIVFLALTKALNAFALWYQHRYIWQQDRRMADRLLESFLSRPYSWFLRQNSAHLNRYLNSRQLTSEVLFSVTEIVAVSILGTVILTALFWVDPKVAAVTTVGVGVAYLVLVTLTRRPIERWAAEGHQLLNQRAMVGHEAVSGFKPILSSGCEGYYLDEFSRISKRGSTLTAWGGMIWELPRFFLEAVALGLILSLTVYFVVWGGMERLLPMLSLYAMAGYRLIPAVHRLLQAVNKIRTFTPDLDAYVRFVTEFPLRELRRPLERLPLKQALRFEQLDFAYEDQPNTLHRVELEIKVNESIGLVGPTGAGKTTIIDLLMGLLYPTGGRFVVDGQALDEEALRRWRSSVGYVPQNVFLKDDSVLRNVAFGVPDGQVDRAAVERAIEAARLQELVESLPQGLETEIGEHGVRLSGGQRQRLGIARALYADPEVLIFDEATSSLDSVTENEVMQAIGELSGQKTLVLVAHRLLTVKECDKIYLLEQGRVSASGTYEELLESSEVFRALAQNAEAT